MISLCIAKSAVHTIFANDSGNGNTSDPDQVISAEPRVPNCEFHCFSLRRGKRAKAFVVRAGVLSLGEEIARS